MKENISNQYLLATQSTASPMKREMAAAILKRTTYTISARNIREAAEVMGKTINAETIATLAHLNACGYADCGPTVLSFLADLGREILA